jgi:hypothetical protein
MRSLAIEWGGVVVREPEWVFGNEQSSGATDAHGAGMAGRMG